MSGFLILTPDKDVTSASDAKVPVRRRQRHRCQCLRAGADLPKSVCQGNWYASANCASAIVPM